MSKKPPKDTSFDPELFLDKCLRELAAQRVDSTTTMSIAMNMMLEIMRLLVIKYPEAGLEPVRQVAGVLEKGFGKIAGAKDALRVIEIIDNKNTFGRKKSREVTP